MCVPSRRRVARARPAGRPAPQSTTDAETEPFGDGGGVDALAQPQAHDQRFVRRLDARQRLLLDDAVAVARQA